MDLLAGEVFEDQTFEGVDVPGADLSNREFVRCTFRNARLGETRWGGSRLEDCVFDSCDLTRQQAGSLALRGVEFRGCKLMGVDWTELGPNPAVKLIDCQLRYASIVGTNLRLTTFKGCLLAEATFAEVSLLQATFDDCDLTGASFDHCDLRQCDFTGARGAFFDPAKNRVKGARVSLATAALVATSLGLEVSGFSDG